LLKLLFVVFCNSLAYLYFFVDEFVHYARIIKYKWSLITLIYQFKAILNKLIRNSNILDGLDYSNTAEMQQFFWSLGWFKYGKTLYKSFLFLMLINNYRMIARISRLIPFNTHHLSFTTQKKIIKPPTLKTPLIKPKTN
jgi:hypothetical protein